YVLAPDGTFAILRYKEQEEIELFKVDLMPSVGTPQKLADTAGAVDVLLVGDRLIFRRGPTDQWARDAHDPSAQSILITSVLSGPEPTRISLSPDGDRLAYWTGDNTMHGDVYLVEFDDVVPSEPVLLVEDSVPPDWMRFTADDT